MGDGHPETVTRETPEARACRGLTGADRDRLGVPAVRLRGHGMAKAKALAKKNRSRDPGGEGHGREGFCGRIALSNLIALVQNSRMDHRPADRLLGAVQEPGQRRAHLVPALP